MDDTKLSTLPGPERHAPEAAEPSWPARGGTSRRHGAISRQLFTYSHYKSWAERMRTAWQKDEEQAEDDAHLHPR